jgi:hypothetical protein
MSTLISPSGVMVSKNKSTEKKVQNWFAKNNQSKKLSQKLTINDFKSMKVYSQGLSIFSDETANVPPRPTVIGEQNPTVISSVTSTDSKLASLRSTTYPLYSEENKVSMSGVSEQLVDHVQDQTISTIAKKLDRRTFIIGAILSLLSLSTLSGIILNGSGNKPQTALSADDLTKSIEGQLAKILQDEAYLKQLFEGKYKDKAGNTTTLIASLTDRLTNDTGTKSFVSQLLPDILQRLITEKLFTLVKGDKATLIEKVVDTLIYGTVPGENITFAEKLGRIILVNSNGSLITLQQFVDNTDGSIGSLSSSVTNLAVTKQDKLTSNDGSVIIQGNDLKVNRTILASNTYVTDNQNFVITNLGTPVNNKDAATKEYVDQAVVGVTPGILGAVVQGLVGAPSTTPSITPVTNTKAPSVDAVNVALDTKIEGVEDASTGVTAGTVLAIQDGINPLNKKAKIRQLVQGPNILLTTNANNDIVLEATIPGGGGGTVTGVLGTAGQVNVSASPSVPVVSLPSVGTAGTTGTASTTPIITTDAFGRVTAVTNTAISLPTTSITGVLPLTKGGTGANLTNGTSGQVLTSNGTGGSTWTTPAAGNAGTVTSVSGTVGDVTVATGTTTPVISLTPTGTAGTYGSATQTPVFTTDSKGRVTSVTNTTITAPAANLLGTVPVTKGGTGLTTTTPGSVLTGGAANTIVQTTAGTTGQVLTSNGAGVPTWTTISATGLGAVTSVSSTTSDITVATPTTTPALTLSNTGVIAGTYPKVIVDAKGRVTAGSALVVADLPAAIPNSKLATSTITLATGTTGTDVNVSGSPVSLGGTVTLNIPDAGPSVRGVMTTSAQVFSGTKSFVANTGFGIATPSHLRLYIAGNYGMRTQAVITAGNYAVAGLDNILIADTTAGAITIQLPDPSINFDRIITVKWNGGAGVLTVTNPNGTAQVDGTASKVFIYARQSVTFFAANNTWLTMSSTGNTGSVTSVGLTLPSIFSVTGSPITSTGTLAATLNAQTANTVFAAPSGVAGTPVFRTLTLADLPTTTHTLTAASSAISSVVNGVTATLTPLAGTIAQNLGFSSTGALVTQAPATVGAGSITGGASLTSTTSGVTITGTNNLLTAGAINIQTATTALPGLLSAADYTTFNSKVGSIGAVGSVPNANSGTITAGVLNLQPASSTLPGVVNATTQEFGGNKTFINLVKTGATGVPGYGLEVVGSGGAWTTSSWPKTAKFGTDGGAAAILFPFNATTQFGFGSTTDGILRLIRSNATTNLGSVNYDLQVNTIGNFGFNTAGSLTATEKVSIASGTAGLSGLKLINLPNTSTAVAGNGKVLSTDSAGNVIFVTDASSGGTVTSVALSAPSIFTVSGSPVTTTGTLGLTLVSQAANTFFAAPSGVAGAPTFRTLTAADLPATTHTLSSTVNTLTSVVNGISATAPSVNTNTLTSTAGNITSLVNGITSGAVAIAGLTTTNLSATAGILNAQLANSTIGTTTGATGLAPAFSSTSTALGGSTVLNIPLASGVGVTSGTITNTQFNTFNGKQDAITLAAVGAVPNANSATLTTGVLTLQPASATLPGVVTAAAQTLGGNKTLSGSTTFSLAPTVTSFTTAGVVKNSAVGLLSGGNLITNSDITNGTIDLTTKVTGALPTTNGGTGLTTYTTGDIPFASATNVLSKLPIGTPGQFLTSVAGTPSWVTVAPGSGWGLAGNTGTNSTINYIGTTDAADFVIRTNALPKLTIGQNNGSFKPTLAAGENLHFSNVQTTSGIQNTSFGNNSQTVNTGSLNTSFGNATLEQNTTGFSNTAIGDRSLNKNTTGTENVAVGLRSLFNATNAIANVAVGVDAMTLATGAANVAVGYQTLQNNIAGSSNVAIGNAALKFDTGSSRNSAVGSLSMFSTTGGVSSDNSAFGYSTMKNVIGNYNTAIGSEAMRDTTTGTLNTALGYRAGFQGGGLLTGTNNTFLGSNTQYPAGGIAGGVTNATAIGANVVLGASDTVILGNNALVGIGTNVPQSKLHVLESVATDTAILVQNEIGNSSLDIKSPLNKAKFIDFSATLTSGATVSQIDFESRIIRDVGSNGDLSIINTGTGAIKLFNTTTASTLNLNSNGSIGIGASDSRGTTGQVLSSNGSLFAPSWINVPSPTTTLGTVITPTVGVFNSANLPIGFTFVQNKKYIVSINATIAHTFANAGVALGVSEMRLFIDNTKLTSGIFSFEDGPTGFIKLSGTIYYNHLSASQPVLVWDDASIVPGGSFSGLNFLATKLEILSGSVIELT